MATISRLLKIIGLFCRISSLLYGSFAKKTHDFKEPTNRSHLIYIFMYKCVYIPVDIYAYVQIHVYMNVHISECSYTYMNIHMHVHIFMCMFIYPYFHISVYMNVDISVFFIRMFAQIEWVYDITAS